MLFAVGAGHTLGPDAFARDIFRKKSHLLEGRSVAGHISRVEVVKGPRSHRGLFLFAQ